MLVIDMISSSRFTIYIKVLYHGPRNVIRKRVGTLNSELIIQYYDLELSVDET
jgi:hypothetical protein